MYSLGYIVLWVAGTTLPLWRCHTDLYKTINIPHALLTLFCSINFMICIWELSLYYHRKFIKNHFMTMKQLLPSGTLPQPMFLLEHVPLAEALTLKHWAKIWSTYSLMDPSYSDPMSFGFWIDVGNGHSMLVPSALFAVGLTWDILPARVLGAISLMAFWQMFYGTILYFLSYFHNERWKGRPGLPLVIATNSVWMLGPGLGMYVCWDMIMTNSFRMVRS